MNEPIDISPVDFSPLQLSEQRRNVMVASVMLRSGHELSRRASVTSPILFLGTWARPMLAAAAVLAMVCGTMLTQTPATQVADMAPGAGMAEVLGVSTATTTLLAANTTPTFSEMLAVDEETR